MTEADRRCLADIPCQYNHATYPETTKTKKQKILFTFSHQAVHELQQTSSIHVLQQSSSES
ncbi:hypothetical protein AMTR_s01995p00002940 [Amborella trichopoda]|uniref:Uncharacterized protein n=1 Tax=Amborella trichopoda TaxID=13333 RepID=U5CV10_AMBTC|nr:hypothetical protein AMTR_s01995p00002940 [Amborella trichopoda]